jgi:hypothetical protein
LLKGDDTPMNESILPNPCPRCQRRDHILVAYASDVVALDALVADLEYRVADLEADNGTLRELLSAALERLAASTQAQRVLRERVAALLLQLRPCSARDKAAA